MRKVLLIILISLFALSVQAQFVGKTDWESEEDYRQVENTIVENILWLEENPFATESNDTKAITEYVLKWLEQTPYISVTLDDIFTDRVAKSRKYKYGDKFLITYLFGKSVYVIQNPEDDSEINASR